MPTNSNDRFLKQALFFSIAGLLSESLGIYLYYVKNYLVITALVMFISQYIHLQTIIEVIKGNNKKEIKNILVYASILILNTVILYMVTANNIDANLSLLFFLLFLITLDFAAERLEKACTELRVMQLTTIFLLLFSLLMQYMPSFSQSIMKISLFASKVASQVSGKHYLIGATYSASSLTALFSIYFLTKASLLKSSKKSWVTLFVIVSPIIVNFAFLILWPTIQGNAIISELVHIPVFAPFNINFIYFVLMLIPLKFSISVSDTKSRQTGFKMPKLVYGVFAILLLVNAVLSVLNFFHKDEFNKNVAFYQIESMPLNFELPSFNHPGLENLGMFGLLPEYLAATGYKTSEVSGITKEKLKNVDILVVINLYQKFTEQEKSDIWEFIKNGGALLAMGDHTGTEQIRDPFNHLLEPVGIALNFDSAIPLVSSWSGGYDRMRNPIMDKIRDNEIKINIGASLSVKPPAKVVISGKYGYSDKGNIKNNEMGYLGDMKYNPGEQLGDLPLVSSAAYGKGRVLVFGDTTTFQNTVISQSYRFIENIFSWLSHKYSKTFKLYVFIISILVIFFLYLADFKTYDLKAVSISTSVLLILVTMFYFNTSSKIKLYGDVKAYKAFITYSNGEYIDIDKTRDSVDGLVANLIRNKFMPFINADISNTRLSGSRDLMVINAPTIKFSPGKIKTIKTFIEKGGMVVITTGLRESDASKELLEEFGISVLNLPIGRITKEMDKDIKAEFWEAWALELDSRYNVKALVSVWNYPVAAYSQYGKGYLLAIGDSAFLLNKNLEEVEQFSQTNIDFLKKILEQYSKGGDISE